MGFSLRILTCGWLFLSIASQVASAAAARHAHCFPFGSARLHGLHKPKESLKEWWCPAEMQFGFMGFSYPLESDNCADASNSLEKMNQDFQRMKEFGATMVRIYAPQCRDETVWRNLLHAGIVNNMAVLPQVWWGFEANQSLWKLTAESIINVLSDPELGPVAPYVFHSIAFGSEPIGDFVDGGYAPFTDDLKAFKAKVEPFGIPVTISEDWDRPGIMSSQDGTGLGPVGQGIAPVIDVIHVHIMPYYHANIFPTADNIWPYFESYIPFLKANLPGKPILISQTLWSSILGGSHDRGWGNPGENIGNFTLYWNIIMSKCQFFKDNRVGWFVHTFDDSQEPGLGMITDSGQTKMSFNPPKC